MRIDKIVTLLEEDKSKILEEIIEYAKSKGFDKVKCEDPWNGYECFTGETKNKSSKEIRELFILLKNGEFREATSEEKSVLIKHFWRKYDNWTNDTDTL